METPFPLPRLLCFSLLVLLSRSAPASYYLDCGATGTTTDQFQAFTGDKSPPAGVRLTGKSTAVSSSSNSTASLYATARVFTSESFYRFDTPAAGTYLLRLHFFPLSDLTSSARFNVSANGHVLLQNFSAPYLLLKEFLLPVDRTLRLYFLPIRSAFVSAIELIPADLSLNSPITATPQGGDSHSFAQLTSAVLSPAYRLNVGGSNVTASDDPLRRIWHQDDPYLVSGKLNTTKFGPNSINYWRQENSTTTDAPIEVYNTARGWNRSSNPDSATNATWRFSMNNNNSDYYFVRAHFYDLVSLSAGEIAFNLYFFTRFVWRVDPYNVTQEPAPFCLDFVVKSDALGFINVSIGSIADIGGAFLNGLEIMEFVTDSAAEPVIDNNGGHGVLIGCVVGGFALVLLLLLLAALVWFMMRKRKRAGPKWRYEARSTSSSHPSLQIRIPIGVIKELTRDFDEGLVIGQGGFGKVYKGVFDNGRKVAVKRSDSRHGQGVLEFQTEISVLSRIRHRHLVSLVGYCDEESEMILVYEFMEKGTLREHLYGAEGVAATDLSWKQRLEICIGAAKGLDYLHRGSGSSGGIIHRDVKSTNILLDERFVAKVADFGLSRAGALEEGTHVSTDVKGTFGYLDPEYYECMQLTEKSDVYSFGVLLLEVLCARPALDASRGREEVNLADWAMQCKEKGEIETIVDRSLVGKMNFGSLKKFVETASECLKESGSDRPPMSDVVWDLEYALQLERFGGQGVGVGDSATTNEASFNLPMLDVPGFSSTAFSMREEGNLGFSSVSGACEDTSQVSVTDSRTSD